jgi:hypothetical protein
MVTPKKCCPFDYKVDIVILTKPWEDSKLIYRLEHWAQVNSRDNSSLCLSSLPVWASPGLKWLSTVRSVHQNLSPARPGYSVTPESNAQKRPGWHCMWSCQQAGSEPLSIPSVSLCASIVLQFVRCFPHTIVLHSFQSPWRWPIPVLHGEGRDRDE